MSVLCVCTVQIVYLHFWLHDCLSAADVISPLRLTDQSPGPDMLDMQEPPSSLLLLDLDYFHASLSLITINVIAAMQQHYC